MRWYCNHYYSYYRERMQTASDSSSINTYALPTTVNKLNNNRDSRNNHEVMRGFDWMDKVMCVLSILVLMGIGFAYMMIAVPSVVNVISHTLFLSLLSLTVSE